MQLMPLSRTRSCVARHRVRVNITATVHPGSPPGRVVDEGRVPAPIKAVVTPAPRPKRNPNVYAKTETNRAADKESRPRRDKDHRGIVPGHVDESRVDWSNRDIGPSAHHHGSVASQISELLGLTAKSLHCVHRSEEHTSEL